MKTNILYAAIAAAALAIIPTLANAQGHEPDNKNYGPRAEVRQPERRRADQMPADMTPAKPEVKHDAKPDAKVDHHDAHPGKPAPGIRPAEPTPALRHEAPAPAPEPEPHKGVRVNIPGINININL